MSKKFFAIAAVALLAACGGDDAAEGDGADSTTVQTMPGTDTINQPTVVPTTDSIVTTVEQDTVQGQAQAGDTVAGDTGTH